jgi:serine-type D-Ala-D-Ala carboxypeptidase (penicillin-binding protein 5/6)
LLQRPEAAPPFLMKRRRRRILLAVVAVALAGGLAAAGLVAAHRLTAPLPPASLVVRAPASLVAALGTPPAIPTPGTGSLFVASSADGELAAADADTERPIASVAKTMTALVVLQADPLAPGAAGPTLTLTPADVALYQRTVAEQGSAVPVTAGEQLSERDLLLALMLPSANNIAETLAVWVAGSRDAFVARLNAEAITLGMSHTHFVDPSGFDPGTVSTATDLAKLARAALDVPALAEIVATPAAKLPDGTELANLDIALGAVPGWLGIKTGWTPQAGGCLLFAAHHVYAPGTPPVTVYGAVLGQPPLASADPAHPELGGAFSVARSAVAQTLAGYAAVTLQLLTPRVSGAISTPWGQRSSLTVRAVAGDVVVRLGTTLALRLQRIQPGATPAAGTLVGRLSGVVAGVDVTWPLVTAHGLTAPSWWWRLLHQ